MKGITPIIATIVLLFITMALLAMAYAFFSGMFNVEKNFSIPVGSSTCSDGTITVYAYNSGQSDLVKDDFDIATIEGVDVTDSIPGTLSIAPGSTGAIFSTKDITDPLAPVDWTGSNNIQIGVGNNIQPTSATC